MPRLTTSPHYREVTYFQDDSAVTNIRDYPPPSGEYWWGRCQIMEHTVGRSNVIVRGTWGGRYCRNGKSYKKTTLTTYFLKWSGGNSWASSTAFFNLLFFSSVAAIVCSSRCTGAELSAARTSSTPLKLFNSCNTIIISMIRWTIAQRSSKFSASTIHFSR